MHSSNFKLKYAELSRHFVYFVLGFKVLVLRLLIVYFCWLAVEVSSFFALFVGP